MEGAACPGTDLEASLDLLYHTIFLDEIQYFLQDPYQRNRDDAPDTRTQEQRARDMAQSLSRMAICADLSEQERRDWMEWHTQGAVSAGRWMAVLEWLDEHPEVKEQMPVGLFKQSFSVSPAHETRSRSLVSYASWRARAGQAVARKIDMFFDMLSDGNMKDIHFRVGQTDEGPYIEVYEGSGA